MQAQVSKELLQRTAEGRGREDEGEKYVAGWITSQRLDIYPSMTSSSDRRWWLTRPIVHRIHHLVAKGLMIIMIIRK